MSVGKKVVFEINKMERTVKGNIRMKEKLNIKKQKNTKIN